MFFFSALRLPAPQTLKKVFEAIIGAQLWPLLIRMKALLEPQGTVYTRKASSYPPFSALLNWFKLVVGPFGQSNI
jgi:hypothetical protein